MANFSDECLITAVLVITLTFCFYLFCSNRKKTFSYWKDRDVPYLKPDWFFGNIRNELLKKSSWPDLSLKCYNTFKEKGYGGIYLFSKPALIVCDPVLVEKILIQNFTSFHDRNESKFDEPMMKTLFNANGELWRVMRSKLISSFTSTKVKGMFDQIIKCCELTTNQIENHIVFSKPVDVGPLMFMYCTEVIASCAFGIQVLSNCELKSKFKTAIDNVFSFNIMKAFRIVLVFVSPKLFSLLGVKFFYRSVSDFFINLTKNTLKYRKENKVTRNDFLNLLMELKYQEENGFQFHEKNERNEDLNSCAGQELFDPESCNKEHIFTDDRIAALVFNFITGGLKPSVSTISLAFLEIAKNPAIQKKVFEEVELAVRKHKGWTYEALRDMRYLDKVIQETLRMHSSGTFLVRMVTEPYTVPGTSLTLEKDLLVYIPVHPLHMDPQLHPSPEVFNPDRFTDSSYKPTSSFLPFGNGPRICIAMKFATTMVKCCLARVLFEYSVEVSDKTQLPLVFEKSEVFPRPEGGIWLSFCKRESTT